MPFRGIEHDPALTGGFKLTAYRPVYWRLTRLDLLFIVFSAMLFGLLAGFSHRMYAGPAPEPAPFYANPRTSRAISSEKTSRKKESTRSRTVVSYKPIPDKRLPVSRFVLWTGIIGGVLGSIILLLWAPGNEPSRYYGPLAVYGFLLFMFDAARGNESLVADFGWGLTLGVMARLVQYKFHRLDRTWAFLSPFAIAAVGFLVAAAAAFVRVPLNYRCFLQLAWTLAYMLAVFLPGVMLSS